MIYSKWLLLQENIRKCRAYNFVSPYRVVNTRAEKRRENNTDTHTNERQNTQIRLFALMFFPSSLPISPPKKNVCVRFSFHLSVVFPPPPPCPLSLLLDCVYMCVCKTWNERDRTWNMEPGDSSKTKCLHRRCQTLPSRQKKMGHRPIPKWTISFFLYFPRRFFSLFSFFHLHSLDPHSVISQPNVIVVLEEEDGTGTLLSEVKQLVKSIREIRSWTVFTSPTFVYFFYISLSTFDPST
jgi:hypothetical protein